MTYENEFPEVLGESELNIPVQPELSEVPTQEQKIEEKEKPIGRATATERVPNSSERFSFWLKPGQIINPFDIVAAEQDLDGSTTYGLVTNIQHTTDAPTHLSNYIANDFGELEGEPNTPRQGTNVADISVLSNTNNTYMPLQNESLVYFADEEGIHVGLGIDTMKTKEQEKQEPICIPAGLIEMSNGTQAVAYLDKEYILGPEGAHINISGISGLATKTSYIMFLIQSILQTMDKKIGNKQDRVTSNDVAVVLVNVKYNDLLSIDDPPSRGMDADQIELWRRLGLEPQEFKNVTYLLPAGKESVSDPSKANCYAPQPDLMKCKIYAYELRDCVDKIDTLLSDVPDEYGTLAAITDAIREGVQSQKNGWENVRTWKQLRWQSPAKAWMEAKKKEDIPGHVPQSSVGRFFRYLYRVVSQRNSGIFVENRNQLWTTINKELSRIEGGHTYVVDIARLHENEQMLVFGDVVRTIYGIFSSTGELGRDFGDFDTADYEPPKKVIIFVDELNKYAPSERGKRSPILDDLLEISERGRSLGVILLSAQQFASSVHDRIIGNAATKVFGRTDPAELSQSNYRFLKDDVKMHLTRLDKGDLVITHPIYRQPIKIKFPKPAYKQQK